jgi:hypothetical protein
MSDMAENFQPNARIKMIDNISGKRFLDLAPGDSGMRQGAYRNYHSLLLMPPLTPPAPGDRLSAGHGMPSYIHTLDHPDFSLRASF